MLAADVQRVFEEILPEDVLIPIVNETGFQERERKLDALKLVRAMVVAASTGYGGRQADVMRMYFKMGAPKVVRGGFYGWFSPALEKVMEAVRELALKFARQQPVDLPGWLGEHVRDWHIVDSETIKLDDCLRAVYPGTGDFAGIKIHKRYSVGIGTAIDYHLSPSREHDAKHLTIDESWRGLGLLVDLGYASQKLIRACEQHGVHYVIRLKENWKPKIDFVARGTVTKSFLAGSDLQALLENDVLLLDGKCIDANVFLGPPDNALWSRLVGVPGVKGYHFYLTNLPYSVGPHQVSDLYRVRWEIESDNKLDQSCLHIDEIQAQKPETVRALIHASMAGAVIINLLAAHHRQRETKPKKPGSERKVPPIHPQSLGRAVGCAAPDIARALTLKGPEAKREWQHLTEYLEHLGKDPNWRSRPSILDQLRGWRITPGRSKNARAASAARQFH